MSISYRQNAIQVLISFGSTVEVARWIWWLFRAHRFSLSLHITFIQSLWSKVPCNVEYLVLEIFIQDNYACSGYNLLLRYNISFALTIFIQILVCKVPTPYQYIHIIVRAMFANVISILLYRLSKARIIIFSSALFIHHVKERKGFNRIYLVYQIAL